MFAGSEDQGEFGRGLFEKGSDILNFLADLAVEILDKAGRGEGS